MRVQRRKKYAGPLQHALDEAKLDAQHPTSGPITASWIASKLRVPARMLIVKRRGV
jgi:hypothetical protein